MHPLISKRRFLQAIVHLIFSALYICVTVFLYTHRKAALIDFLLQIIASLLLVIISILCSSLILYWIDRLLIRASFGRQAEKEFVSSLSRLSSIQAPPGAHLRSFASTVFSKKVFSLVLEPTLRDMLDEYCEALSEGRSRKAQWVRLRGYYSFWSAVLAQLPLSLTKLLFTVWKGVKP